MVNEETIKPVSIRMDSHSGIYHTRSRNTCNYRSSLSSVDSIMTKPIYVVRWNNLIDNQRSVLSPWHIAHKMYEESTYLINGETACGIPIPDMNEMAFYVLHEFHDYNGPRGDVCPVCLKNTWPESIL